jgi:hypothetical protein
MEKIVRVDRVKSEDCYVEGIWGKQWGSLLKHSLQAGRTRVRFPMWLFGSFVDLLLPPWGRLIL